jgi:hypothetical protein
LGIVEDPHAFVFVGNDDKEGIHRTNGPSCGVTMQAARTK